MCDTWLSHKENDFFQFMCVILNSYTTISKRQSSPWLTWYASLTNWLNQEGRLSSPHVGCRGHANTCAHTQWFGDRCMHVPAFPKYMSLPTISKGDMKGTISSIICVWCLYVLYLYLDRVCRFHSCGFTCEKRFQICIYLWQNFITLRWPSAVDRALNSNY